MKEELLKGLSEEQIAKVKACKNTEEMLAIAKEEGVELTDEQLEAVSGGCGGGDSNPVKCPQCGSIDLTYYPMRGPLGGKHCCNNCGNVFRVNK